MATSALLRVETPSSPPESAERIQSTLRDNSRVQSRGKFLFVDEHKLYVRGVTYGTFQPDDCGLEYGSVETVERDFAAMAVNGINAVRLYTVPPLWLLDLAQHHGLRAMVGLAWEQHVAFLDDRKLTRAIERRVRAQVRRCAGHPAIMTYAVGNEIPASIVRWHGRARIERFLERLYRVVKAEDPAALVTYVNYPSTEYLQLPFLDLVAFNVYLEERIALQKYLARLQNIAGDRPLLLAEVGLDSQRHGEEAQACSLDWQVRTAFAGGCAGCFVFGWTDEWHRGGHAILDWDFGLTDRERREKAALRAVRAAFRELPFPEDWPWPCISVVVCVYNGERTLRGCLEALLKLEYSSYEVIVVNDGSTDGTLSIAREFPFGILSTPNLGLSNARNLGMSAARGEIVAYIDDDAYPDPQWLTYLAATFLTTEHAGVGGPNLPPPGDGWIADAVANAPGGPIHVLLSDTEAEHIPGCNMALRKAALEAVGGFDTRFRVAGDDVHVCWLLAQEGRTLGYNPAAVVWHHRRSSVRAYFKQQRGYGRAEALLEQRWPEKYNTLGHLTWGGRVYGKGAPILSWRRARIYGGTWGSAPFQSLYEPAPSALSALLLMPEWYLILLGLAGFTALGAFFRPTLLLAFPLALAVLLTLIQAARGAARATFTSRPGSRFQKLRLYALTVLLHLLQPLARLSGRLGQGLTPWRQTGRGFAAPWRRSLTLWSEEWRRPEERLAALESALLGAGARLRRGGDYDDWDLEVQSGLLGGARLCMTIEEHGAGRQLVRMRLRPRFCTPALVAVPLAALAVAASSNRAWGPALTCGALALLLAGRALLECAVATGLACDAARRQNYVTELVSRLSLGGAFRRT